MGGEETSFLVKDPPLGMLLGSEAISRIRIRGIRGDGELGEAEIPRPAPGWPLLAGNQQGNHDSGPAPSPSYRARQGQLCPGAPRPPLDWLPGLPETPRFICSLVRPLFQHPLLLLFSLYITACSRLPMIPPNWLQQPVCPCACVLFSPSLPVTCLSPGGRDPSSAWRGLQESLLSRQPVHTYLAPASVQTDRTGTRAAIVWGPGSWEKGSAFLP